MQAPLYQHIISTARQSVRIFDETTLDEIRNFLKCNQHESGGFKDRVGKPDLYYSLFGLWLAMALDEPESQNRLLAWIESRRPEKFQSVIEVASLILIRKTLKMRGSFYLKFKLLFRISGARNNISPYYRLFIALLLIDTFLPNLTTLRWPGLRRLLKRAEIMTSSCTEAAAALVVASKTGSNTGALQDQLVSFFNEEQGFRAFNGKKDGDMLSTAAALFALDYSGYDLRAMTPACLDFLSCNYSEGAFLSGDGDPELDIEYTFYGLLAAGSLYKKD